MKFEKYIVNRVDPKESLDSLGFGVGQKIKNKGSK